ncbi:MAG: DUF4349 domain-containing protein [Phycisphaerae bacterium]|nr:DUF4349 domain-containing protein [Phycisphaerae bacterium]NIS53595.1 DUF4349 domain-containing protein [Phycisphaerae bacterium]NIU08208.1 DUF4349 domain-containing protein [Phycisphaerae bacterium]NIU55719.1 DUF4349 domain-containing protein [Phycisphaerae bacterium]NIW92190.1 DUF4349 domain-containing protein [Phycisphaerae bacterium]
MSRINFTFSVFFVVACAFVLCGCQGGDAQFALRESRMEDFQGETEGFYAGESPKLYSTMTVSEREAEPEKLPEAESPEVDTARSERLVVYNAVINVVVQNISQSIGQLRSTVSAMGGYMQSMTSSSITLKVPAKRFTEALAEVEKLGEVTHKDIKGTDVTEQMRDLNIRLANAENVRGRLTKLLERADKVEDAIKIEKELERITETIELLKGKISHLKNSVAFSTLTVHFNSPVPQKDIGIKIPFYWVHELGTGLTEPVRKYRYTRSSPWRKSMFDLPGGYVKYYEDRYSDRAMSAESVMIYAHSERNYKGGEVEFWATLVRRVLVGEKVFNIDKREELELKGKRTAVVLRGSKEIGLKQYGYLIALATSKKYVTIFEAWGPLEEFEKDRSKIEEAVKSLRVR